MSLEFQTLGGNPKLLQYLLKQSARSLMRRDPDSPATRRAWAEQLRLAGKTLDIRGARRIVIDEIDWHRKQLLETRPHYKLDLRQYFWAAALLPYLRAVTGRSYWHWLGGWIETLSDAERAAAEPPRSSPEDIRVGISRGWRFLRAAKASAKKRLSIEQSLIARTVLCGIETTICWMRGTQMIANHDSLTAETVLGVRHLKGHAISSGLQFFAMNPRGRRNATSSLESDYFKEVINQFAGLRKDLDARQYRKNS